MKLLVIVARGLSVLPLGPYGNRWIDTPTLDALAASGVVFDWHFADHPDPAGARRAWRTGRYRLPRADGTLPAGDGPDLPAALRQAGVVTRLIHDTTHPLPAEFPGGWDRTEGIAASANTSLLEAALNAAESALNDLRDTPNWLLWLDLASLLPPWRVPADFLDPYFAPPQPEEDEEDEDEDEEEEERLEDEEEEEPLEPLLDPGSGAIDREDDELYLRIQTTFAAAVSYLDVALGELLQILRDQPGEEPVLLVTSDRGQALGERSVVGTGALHEEIVHLPLILYGVGGEGRRVAALTQAVDLAPTMAELFGVPWPATDGRSLLPLARGESVPWREEALCGQVTERGVEWGLRTAEWFFRLTMMPEGPKAALFVKPDDRLEVNDVVQQHLEPAEELERRLRERVGLREMPP